MENNNTKVKSQLDNMVKFIDKEAKEKAQEIRDKTQAEYSIEKSKIVIAQKEKISVDFNKRQQQVLVDKRIAFSHEITKFRLEILQVREKGIRIVVEKATSSLNAISKTPQYKDLLVRLILQGVQKLIDEKDIVVKVREEDLGVAKEALSIAQGELKKHGKTNNLKLDEANKLSFLAPGKTADGKPGDTCAGGVVLTAKVGKIVCDNTLDARLRYAYDDLVPILRKTLFDEPDRVPTVMEDKGHAH